MVVFPGANDARRGERPPVDVVETLRFMLECDVFPASSSARARALPVGGGEPGKHGVG